MNSSSNKYYGYPSKEYVEGKIIGKVHFGKQLYFWSHQVKKREQEFPDDFEHQLFNSAVSLWIEKQADGYNSEQADYFVLQFVYDRVHDHLRPFPWHKVKNQYLKEMRERLFPDGL